METTAATNHGAETGWLHPESSTIDQAGQQSPQMDLVWLYSRFGLGTFSARDVADLFNLAPGSAADALNEVFGSGRCIQARRLSAAETRCFRIGRLITEIGFLYKFVEIVDQRGDGGSAGKLIPISASPVRYFQQPQLVDGVLSLLVVASQGDDIVGSVQVRLDPNESLASARSLYVGEGFRRRGIGRKLMEFGLTAAVDLKFQAFGVLVNRLNAPAMAFYVAMGFWVAGVDGDSFEMLWRPGQRKRELRIVRNAHAVAVGSVVVADR